MVNEDILDRNWVTELKELLFVNGFGYIWNNQGARDINAFILSFERRLKDSYTQNRAENVSGSRKLCTSHLKPRPLRGRGYRRHSVA